MSLLNKYILKGYFKIFIIIQMIMIWIFMVVDYLSNLDKFVEAGFGLTKGLYFISLKIPFILVHLTPVSIILSIVILFGLMNKNKEIIALCSSGVELKKIYMPLVLVSFALSFAVFFISNSLMPSTTTTLNRIYLTEIKKKKIISEKRNEIWVKDNNKIIYIDYFNPDLSLIRNIKIYQFDEKQNLKKRTSAKTGYYKEKKWHLFDIQSTDNLNLESGQRIVNKKSEITEFDFSPVELKEIVKKPDEMGIFQLKEYIKQLKEKGYDSNRFNVDFHRKIAFPFVCVIMTLLGSIIGLNSATGKKIPIAVASSLGLSFVYWSLYSFLVSLGYGERISPAAAAWTANIIFGILGSMFLIFREKKLITN